MDSTKLKLCPTCDELCIVDHRLDALRGPDHQCSRDHTWRDGAQPPSREPAPPVTDAEAEAWHDRYSDRIGRGMYVSPIVLRLLADRARAQERIVALEEDAGEWSTIAESAVELLRNRPGWSSDVPEEERLAWWRLAADECAAYDKFMHQEMPDGK